ncbi:MULTISPECIES: UDP-N-acetylmuramate dehydrogenase [Exiguobacterium]|uniref:UDP-N-acetylenolpyruvoylglucosamine reductase n=1 Tax=Exiguobacterium acetylicum TaxID=41170 RepID=A0ABX8GBD6_EXIAC|nr:MULTISPECIES: UDP-N-acetylmuramate dehydrogenase [Exiguobacterium]AOS99720.1 UDP-N-acetylenolpyruvoylglucosamine reductase [Exiguobacterium sp. U13-1]QWB30676.1 UDP-N-acetylmuramate dehydrogenase [Exiguobacterium acetylicum]
MTEQVMTGLYEGISKESVLINEPLKYHTYTKMGGIADLFIIPTSYEETAFVVRYAHEQGIPLTLLGNGSNLVVRDGGIRGIVLSFEKLTDISVEGHELVAQSGAAIIEASRVAYAHQLSGLEFACGIPGTIGGALIMNAGAYGGEVKDCLHSATVLTRQGELLNISHDELELGYRTSCFSKKEYIILEGRFALTEGDPALIKEVMDDLTHKRETKQPLEYPSCGSVFKRPEGYFAGKLIQDSNLQGTRIGGAEVSKKHAGFIVNVENASASDYIALIRHVQETVQEKFGILLETEVKIIGEEA